MRHSAYLVIVVFAFSCWSGLAWAEPAAETTDVAAFSSPTVAPLSRLAVAIGAVGAIGWGLALWSRRRRAGVHGGNTRIQVLATHNVGPRHQVALLEVGERRLLVGMGGDSIATLADLTADTTFSDELAKNIPLERNDGKRTLVDVIGHFEGLDG